MVRKHRAARTPSTAANIDRTADRPLRGEPAFGGERVDELRPVQMEEDAAEEAQGIDFWLDQRPPHFGGEG